VTKRRRSNGELIRDRRLCADLYLKGWLQSEIAEHLGLSQQTISNDLKACHARWQAETLTDIGELKGREIAKIDLLEREAWDAWVRSCADAETMVQKEKRSAGAAKDRQPAREMTKTTKGQVGDPRFLATVQWCINRRCEIYGVDAPEVKEFTGPGGSALAGGPDVISIYIHDGSDDE
jgi:predicted transcriptional regulator